MNENLSVDFTMDEAFDKLDSMFESFMVEYQLESLNEAAKKGDKKSEPLTNATSEKDFPAKSRRRPTEKDLTDEEKAQRDANRNKPADDYKDGTDYKKISWFKRALLVVKKIWTIVSSYLNEAIRLFTIKTKGKQIGTEAKFIMNGENLIETVGPMYEALVDPNYMNTIISVVKSAHNPRTFNKDLAAKTQIDKLTTEDGAGALNKFNIIDAIKGAGKLQRAAAGMASAMDSVDPSSVANDPKDKSTGYVNEWLTWCKKAGTQCKELAAQVGRIVKVASKSKKDARTAAEEYESSTIAANGRAGNKMKYWQLFAKRAGEGKPVTMNNSVDTICGYDLDDAAFILREAADIYQALDEEACDYTSGEGVDLNCGDNMNDPLGENDTDYDPEVNGAGEDPDLEEIKDVAGAEGVAIMTADEGSVTVDAENESISFNFDDFDF